VRKKAPKKPSDRMKALRRMQKRTFRDDGVRKVEHSSRNKDDGLIWWGTGECWTPEQLHHSAKLHFAHSGPLDFPNWRDDPSYNWRKGRKRDE